MIDHDKLYNHDVIRWNVDAVEETHKAGLALADALEAGDLSQIPDGVMAFLYEHSDAVNLKAPGQKRLLIAGMMAETPTTTDLAHKLGSEIVELVSLTNDKVAEFEAVQVTMGEQARIRFGNL